MWIVAKRGGDRGAGQDEALGVSHAIDTDMAIHQVPDCRSSLKGTQS